MFKTAVLVIGGGPAGSTAARFLAQHSIDIILVERDLSYKKPCGGGIPSSALIEFEIPEDVVKKKINKVLVVSPKGKKVDVKLKDGYLAITERGEFDKRLRQLAQEKGALIIEGEFLRFEDISKNIVAIVRERSTNKEIKIKSDYVIASDGVTSKVGSLLNRNKIKSIWTINTHLKPFSDQSFEHAEFWFGSEHATDFYSWLFPSCSYISIGTGSRDVRELVSLLDKFIKRRFGKTLRDFQSDNLLSKLRAFKIPEWDKSIFNIGNILFVGDTASIVMPVTYEGIYYAMKSGEFAANALIERSPSIYKKLWDERFKNRFFVMNKIKKYLFRKDQNIEKFVSIHQHPEAQELAMRLWLKKEKGTELIKSYFNIFKKILRLNSNLNFLC
jgi:geranylgeranyl reductase